MTLRDCLLPFTWLAFDSCRIRSNFVQPRNYVFLFKLNVKSFMSCKSVQRIITILLVHYSRVHLIFKGFYERRIYCCRYPLATVIICSFDEFVHASRAFVVGSGKEAKNGERASLANQEKIERIARAQSVIRDHLEGAQSNGECCVQMIV